MITPLPPRVSDDATGPRTHAGDAVERDVRDLDAVEAVTQRGPRRPAVRRTRDRAPAVQILVHGPGTIAESGFRAGACAHRDAGAGRGALHVAQHVVRDAAAQLRPVQAVRRDVRVARGAHGHAARFGDAGQAVDTREPGLGVGVLVVAVALLVATAVVLDRPRAAAVLGTDDGGVVGPNVAHPHARAGDPVDLELVRLLRVVQRDPAAPTVDGLDERGVCPHGVADAGAGDTGKVLGGAAGQHDPASRRPRRAGPCRGSDAGGGADGYKARRGERSRWEAHGRHNSYSMFIVHVVYRLLRGRSTGRVTRGRCRRLPQVDAAHSVYIANNISAFFSAGVSQRADQTVDVVAPGDLLTPDARARGRPRAQHRRLPGTNTSSASSRNHAESTPTQPEQLSRSAGRRRR